MSFMVSPHLPPSLHLPSSLISCHFLSHFPSSQNLIFPFYTSLVVIIGHSAFPSHPFLPNCHYRLPAPQVKPRQEYVVKVKNFLPPHADEPEIHILEISEELLRYAPSLSNLIASDNEVSDSHGANSRLSSRLQHFELFQRHGNNLKPEDAERSQGGDSDGGKFAERVGSEFDLDCLLSSWL